jgi:hypothetical protein
MALKHFKSFFATETLQIPETGAIKVTSYYFIEL